MKSTNLWYLVGIFFLALTARIYAEDATSTATATASESKVYGLFDFRPTWTTKRGSFGTENVARLGYQFNKDRILYYNQDYYSNLYTPHSAAVSGVNPTFDPGFVGFKMNNLYKNTDAGTSISYEPRLYLPIGTYAQNSGLVTMNRHYFRFAKKVSDTVAISLFEIPIINVFQNSGYVAAGTPTANPVFENRVYLITDIKLGEKLSLSLPVFFYQTRFGNYQAGAANNDSWGFQVLTWPELDYAIDAHSTVGVAYYNVKSFFTPDLKKAQFSEALESGAIQMIYNYSL